jgi:hypothetical protein
MDVDPDFLKHVDNVVEEGQRLHELIDASDFGPNSAEVLTFLARFDKFTWDDWRSLQKAYVASLNSGTKLRPSLKVLEEATAAAGIFDQAKAAGWAAMGQFPVAQWQTQPPDINNSYCEVPAATAARAVAARYLIPTEDFDKLFEPFVIMAASSTIAVPATTTPMSRAGGCGSTTLAILLSLISALIIAPRFL